MTLSYDYIPFRVPRYSSVKSILKGIQNSRYSDIPFLDSRDSYKNINNKSNSTKKSNLKKVIICTNYTNAYSGYPIYCISFIDSLANKILLDMEKHNLRFTEKDLQIMRLDVKLVHTEITENLNKLNQNFFDAQQKYEQITKKRSVNCYQGDGHVIKIEK